MLLAVPGSAGADGDGGKGQDEAVQKAKAQALVRAATELYFAAKYEEALPLFVQAYELYPSPKIVMNTGSTLAKLGRTAEAANQYEKFLRQPGRDRSKDGEVRAILERDLAPGLARLKLVFSGPAPTKARIFVDDLAIEQDSANALIWVEPGKRTVRVEGADVAVKPVAVTAAIGAIAEVKIATGAKSRLDRNAVNPDDEGQDSIVDSPGRAYRIAFWAGAALTVTSLTLGVVNHARIGSLEDEKDEHLIAFQEATGVQLSVDDVCSAAKALELVPIVGIQEYADLVTACDDGERAALYANVFYGAAVITAAATAFFLYKGYLASPASDTKPGPVAIVPTISPHVVGAELTWRF